MSLTRKSEAVYVTLLVLCFLYILVSSLVVENRPIRHTSTAGDSSSGSFISLGDDALSEDSTSDAARHPHSKTAAASESQDDKQQNGTFSPLEVGELDDTRMTGVVPYLRAIMDSKDAGFSRLQCPRPFKDRYRSLQTQLGRDSESEHDQLKKRYFFALNLYQCVHVLPRLMASVVGAMQKVGPEDCVLSIVGGRSDDGTTEILFALREEIESLGVTYYFGTSQIDPLKYGHDRVTELAKLRNLAVAPLLAKHHRWSTDATVIFLNDVSICTDDILELIFQKQRQQADMVCAMDWNHDGANFYDMWIARSMNGDMFVEIPQSASYEFAGNLFWNDGDAQYHIREKLPLQVFACWNGAVAFKAEPLLLHNLKFRAPYRTECYTGEPTLFCKDLWALGYGRIAVIPSVNVGYDDEQSRAAKMKHGYASGNIEVAELDKALSTEISWRDSPPTLVKCQPDWTHTSWAPWDDALEEHLPFDWTRSGYFNAKKPYSPELVFEDEGEDDEVS